MILYHYTREEWLPGIRALGLKPFKFLQEDWPPNHAVWFSRFEYQQDFWNLEKEIRITCDIPADDPLLSHWGLWMRQHHPERFKRLVTNLLYDGWKSFWCYRGTVPLDYIVAIERSEFFNFTLRVRGLDVRYLR